MGINSWPLGLRIVVAIFLILAIITIVGMISG